jgi:WD40 repeat protein
MTPDDVFVKDLERFLDGRAGSAPAGYLAETLERTSEASQVRWWSSPERWLPMDLTLRRPLLGRTSVRALAILAVIGLLIAAIAAYAVGTQHRLPPPFGMARNGEVVVSTDGDIYTVDPSSGQRRLLVGGETFDFGGVFDRQGTRFLFLRGAPSGCGKADCGLILAVANADGSAVRELTPPTRLLDWVDWSPDGTQIAYLGEQQKGDGHSLNVVNVDGTGLRTLDVHRPAHELAWRLGADEIVFRGDQVTEIDPAPGIFAVHPDGTGLRELSPSPATFQNDFQGVTVSSDGDLLAFMRTDADSRFQVHILDLRSGQERVLPAPDGMAQMGPAFSPDATHILYVRAGDDGRVRLVVAPVDASTPGRELGPTIAGSGEAINNQGWSPDGTAVYANYDSDKTARLLPIDGSTPIVLGTGELALVGYQRLAP